MTATSSSLSLERREIAGREEGNRDTRSFQKKHSRERTDGRREGKRAGKQEEERETKREYSQKKRNLSIKVSCSSRFELHRV
jgi:hypothetical protein